MMEPTHHCGDGDADFSPTESLIDRRLLAYRILIGRTCSR